MVLGESGLPYVVSELDKSLPLTGLAMLGGDPQPFMLAFPGLIRNIDLLEKAAMGRGLFTISQERDGLVRRVPVMMQAQGIVMPSLSFEMLRAITGTDTILIKSDRAGIKSIAVKGLEIPTDSEGRIWVHFAKRDPSIYVSASDVLDGTVQPGMIARHLVLIGTSAVGLLDTKTTPLDAVIPGVEVHAQVLESALHEDRAVAARLYAWRRTVHCDHSRHYRDLARPDVRARHPRHHGRRVCGAARRYILVFLHAAPPADRLHLSACSRPR